MKIIYFGIDNLFGGLENFAKNLITSCISKDKNLSFTIITQFPDVAFKDYFLSIGVEIVVIPDWKKHPLSFYQYLLKLFKENQNALLHLNLCTYRNFFLLLAAKKSKIRTIITSQLSKVSDKKMVLIHKINRWFFRNLGLKVRISDISGDFAFYKGHNSILLYDGIETSKYCFSSKSRDIYRRKNGIKSNDICIGQIARFSVEKNQQFTLELFKSLSTKYPDLHLFFVGNNFPSDFVNGISNAHILPACANINEIYSMFDLCLLPSINEGFGMVTIEMACNGLVGFISSSTPPIQYSSNLKYLPLNLDLWCKEISCFLDNTPLNYERPNFLLNSEYDINVVSDRYLDLYRNYDKLFFKFH